jgi:hypothetical protein
MTFIWPIVTSEVRPTEDLWGAREDDAIGKPIATGLLLRNF